MHTTPDSRKTAMAVFHDLRLMSLAVLMLASQLDFASAAVRVFGLHARDLTGDPAGNKPDPYVKVWCGSTFGGQTEYIKDTANPSWSAEFNFPNCKANENLKLEVWDKDLNYDDKLGTCTKQVQNGSFSNNCYLNKGTVFYRYEAK
ncbi:perforin-1-like [Chanodichthys erythropterus]|uniref:perforin-1-like n=1 Tax=Chanodichthys erythropterus TaxID=933992 RepID=UPI00351F1E66